MTVPAHSIRSPSGRHRWSRCPGSILAEAKIGERPAGPAAIDGTHSHTLLDHCLRKSVDPLSTIGQSFTDHEGEFVVNDSRALRVKVATDYVAQRVLQMGGMCTVESEVRVDLAYIFKRNDLAGTSDVILIGGGVCEVIDYKDGMNFVDAKDNEQMEQYAFGVLARYEQALNQPFPFSQIRMTIIQPKVADKGMNPISSHELSVTDFVRTRLGVLAAQVAKTDHADPVRVAGEIQCRYCAAKGACPELAEYALRSAGVEFPVVADSAAEEIVNVLGGELIPFEETPILDQVNSFDVHLMSGDRLAQIIEAAPLVRQFLEAVEEEATIRLQNRQQITGLKLVAGRGRSQWAMEDDKIAEKLSGMGVPKSAIWKTDLVTPAQAKKLVWKNRAGEVNQLSPRQVETLEKEYIKKSFGAPQIALASDSRPSIIEDVSPMFTSVNEQQAILPAVTQESMPSWLDAPDWLK